MYSAYREDGLFVTAIAMMSFAESVEFVSVTFCMHAQNQVQCLWSSLEAEVVRVHKYCTQVKVPLHY